MSLSCFTFCHVALYWNIHADSYQTQMFPKKTTTYFYSYTNCTKVSVWVLWTRAPLIADPLSLPRRRECVEILLSYQLAICTIYFERPINTSIQLKCLSLTAETAYLLICLTDQQWLVLRGCINCTFPPSRWHLDMSAAVFGSQSIYRGNAAWVLCI